MSFNPLGSSSNTHGLVQQFQTMIDVNKEVIKLPNPIQVVEANLPQTQEYSSPSNRRISWEKGQNIEEELFSDSSSESPASPCLSTETSPILSPRKNTEGSNEIADKLNKELQKMDECTFQIKNAAIKKDHKEVTLTRTNGVVSPQLEKMKTRTHESCQAFEYYLNIAYKCLAMGMEEYDRQREYLLSILYTSNDKGIEPLKRKIEKTPIVVCIEQFLERKWAKRVMRKHPKLFSEAIRFLFSQKRNLQIKSLHNSHKFVSNNPAHFFSIITTISEAQNLFFKEFKKKLQKGDSFSERLLTSFDSKQLSIYVGVDPKKVTPELWEKVVDDMRKPCYVDVADDKLYRIVEVYDDIKITSRNLNKIYKCFQADPLTYFKDIDPGQEKEKIKIKKAISKGDATALYSLFIERHDNRRNVLSSQFKTFIKIVINRAIDIQKVDTPEKAAELEGIQKRFDDLINEPEISIEWQKIGKEIEQLVKYLKPKYFS